MIKRKTLFYLTICAIAGLTLVHRLNTPNDKVFGDAINTTKYGAFLAAQHAIYVNDFESLTGFIDEINDVEYESVKSTKIFAQFLGGKIPTDVKNLESDKDPASRLIYDTYLVENDKWDELYKRRHTEKSAIYAPLRIWSAIAKNRITETFKYLDSLDSNPSWKFFVRGQIYAEQGDTERAADEFANVKPSFMNINDYLYIMSFYTAHNKTEAAKQLHHDFSSTPGGMFMSDYENIPAWENYSGIKGALAFDLIQNVSHTQIIMYSDLAILMLRSAQIIGPDSKTFQEMIDYYTGQFMANVGGNYKKYFNTIDSDNPYYLFAKMRIDETPDAAKHILNKHPLFIPALNKLIAYRTAAGDRRGALRIINRALKNKALSDSGRAYLIKRRALVNLLFDDLDAAQRDIRNASSITDIDDEILSIQARIWAEQGREIENAYDYAMTLVKKNPNDVVAWDIVAVVVGVREGNDAALEILEKIAASATKCSSLFEHLGDAYMIKGDKKSARTAYMRAMELSTDGLSIAPKIQKKLRKAK